MRRGCRRSWPEQVNGQIHIGRALYLQREGEAWLEVEGSRGAFGWLHLSILGQIIFAGDTR